MDATAIERSLSLLGEELQAMNVQESIQLLLIGGGYMLTQIGNRAATGDLDTAWMHPEVFSDSELYRVFQAAVQFVAHDEGLEPSWLSTDASDFLRAAGPFPPVTLWKQFGPRSSS